MSRLATPIRCEPSVSGQRSSLSRPNRKSVLLKNRAAEQRQVAQTASINLEQQIFLQANNQIQQKLLRKYQSLLGSCVPYNHTTSNPPFYHPQHNPKLFEWRKLWTDYDKNLSSDPSQLGDMRMAGDASKPQSHLSHGNDTDAISEISQIILNTSNSRKDQRPGCNTPGPIQSPTLPKLMNNKPANSQPNGRQVSRTRSMVTYMPKTTKESASSSKGSSRANSTSPNILTTTKYRYSAFILHSHTFNLILIVSIDINILIAHIFGSKLP